jgi:hypothetical protein
LFYRPALVNSSSLKFDYPKGVNLSCYSTLSSTEALPFNFKEYELGKVVYANDDKSEITVLANVDGERIKICDIALSERFAASPFQYDKASQQLLFTARSFVGSVDGKIILDFGEHGKVNLESVPQKSLEITGLSEGVYPCKILRPASAFVQSKSKTIWAGDVVVGEKEKFLYKGKCLHITRVNLGWESDPDKIQNWLVPHYNYYVDDIVGIYLDEQWYYTGKLFYKIGESRNYMDVQKNSKGIYENINPVRIEFRTKNSFWLVAGYKDRTDFLGELFFEKEKGRISNNDRLGKVINLYKCEVVNNV